MGAEETSAGLLASFEADSANDPAVALREGDLQITLTLPAVVVGSHAVGTALGPQTACLNLLKLDELSSAGDDGDDMLARVVSASVLAAYIGWISRFAQSAIVVQGESNQSGLVI